LTSTSRIKVVTISATLPEEEEKELLDFLNKNKDVFAWSAVTFVESAKI